jgi:hypothetical protein
MPLPADHGSPVLVYDGFGLLHWTCTCKDIAGKEQGAAITPFDAIGKWNSHADTLPAKHRNPSSPHVLVVEHPLLPFVGSIRASCDACDHALGSWDNEPGWAIGLAFAAFARHV